MGDAFTASSTTNLGCLRCPFSAIHDSTKERLMIQITQTTGSIFYFIYVILYTLLSLSGNLHHLTWVRPQQPQEQRYPVPQVHAGSFRVSVIHRAPTWTTGSLSCICDRSYACVYTQGLGTPPTTQHRVFGSRVRCSTD